MNQTLGRPRAGFTIVELLIVIVIIAILAAITVVAFNGVQQRAENAKTASALNAYKKILQQYAIAKEQQISTGGMCLGDQYPLLSATAAGCRYSSAVLPNMSSSTKTALNEVASSFPMPSTKKYTNTAGTVDYMGMWFYGTTYNYQLNDVASSWIMYVYGDRNCPEPSYRLTTDPNGGYDASLAPASGNYYSLVNATTALCLSLI